MIFKCHVRGQLAFVLYLQTDLVSLLDMNVNELSIKDI